MSLGSDLWVPFSETKLPFGDLNGVTDEDTNSILTVAMQVTQSGGKTNANGAIR